MESLPNEREDDPVLRLEKRLTEKEIERAIKENDVPTLQKYMLEFKDLVKDYKDAIYDYKSKMGKIKTQYEAFTIERGLVLDELIKENSSLKEEQGMIIEQLEQDFSDLKDKKQDEIEEIRHEYERNIKEREFQKGKLDKILEKQTDLKVKETQLLEERENLTKELEQLRNDNTVKKTKMKYESELEMRTLRETNEQLEKDYSKIKEYKDNVDEKFQKLQTEKDSHDLRLEAQKNERLELLQKNKKARNEFLRNEEGMIEYQTLTYKQSKKIQELKNEIKDLNKKFPEEVAKYTRELEFLKYDNESKNTELELTYQNLSDVLRLRHKESKKLRRLMQLIMDQRSELEHFFIEAISIVDKVRLEEMERESMDKRNGVVLNPALTTMRTKGHFKPRMGWEDRERVLKIVFSKINSGEIPLYWREIDVDDLREELIKEVRDYDGEHLLITGEEMKQRLNRNIEIQNEIRMKDNEQAQRQESSEQKNEGDEEDEGFEEEEEEENSMLENFADAEDESI